MLTLSNVVVPIFTGFATVPTVGTHGGIIIAWVNLDNV
jgi:hypothetical protein